MALWGGRFTRQQINGSNNSTTHCALITVWRSRILLALWPGPKPTVGVLTAEEQAQLEEALNVLLEDVRASHNKSLKATPKISIAGWKAN